MNYMVFDTETTDLMKPFCYNVGLAIFNNESPNEPIAKVEYVIEQIWHNLPLFQSAYYADKRPIYVGRMRSRAVRLEKWGYAMQAIARLIKEYDVQYAFAYNAPFDEKVFDYNCDWFKTQNPLETVPIIDIAGYVHNFIAFTDEFQQFCEQNKCFTESGNYSTTAETLFRYISQDMEFEEEHTALSDVLIENAILQHCVDKGANIGTTYKKYNSVPRKIGRTLTIKTADGQKHTYDYNQMRMKKDRSEIILK